MNEVHRLTGVAFFIGLDAHRVVGFESQFPIVRQTSSQQCFVEIIASLAPVPSIVSNPASTAGEFTKRGK
jgi:hypothetical protein